MTTSRTLSSAVFPDRSRLADLTLVLGTIAVVSALAQIAIPLPFTPVPLTGQTLGVLLSGIVLGRDRAALAMVLYVALGAVGAPVFAGGKFGLGGPTTGYLLAFPLAAALTGWLAERGWDRKPLTAALAMLTGSLAIFALGASWLSVSVGGLKQAVLLGVLPFVPGDLIKTAIASGASSRDVEGRRSSKPILSRCGASLCHCKAAFWFYRASLHDCRASL
jgi:biotin transport system substrate-specific component